MMYLSEGVFIICALALTYKICQLVNVIIVEAKHTHKLEREIMKREFENYGNNKH